MGVIWTWRLLSKPGKSISIDRGLSPISPYLPSKIGFPGWYRLTCVGTRHEWAGIIAGAWKQFFSRADWGVWKPAKRIDSGIFTPHVSGGNFPEIWGRKKRKSKHSFGMNEERGEKILGSFFFSVVFSIVDGQWWKCEENYLLHHSTWHTFCWGIVISLSERGVGLHVWELNVNRVVAWYWILRSLKFKCLQDYMCMWEYSYILVVESVWNGGFWK